MGAVLLDLRRKTPQGNHAVISAAAQREEKLCHNTYASIDVSHMIRQPHDREGDERAE